MISDWFRSLGPAIEYGLRINNDMAGESITHKFVALAIIFPNYQTRGREVNEYMACECKTM